jgi:hypothetical protein
MVESPPHRTRLRGEALNVAFVVRFLFAIVYIGIVSANLAPCLQVPCLGVVVSVVTPRAKSNLITICASGYSSAMKAATSFLQPWTRSALKPSPRYGPTSSAQIGPQHGFPRLSSLYRSGL